MTIAKQKTDNAVTTDGNLVNTVAAVDHETNRLFAGTDSFSSINERPVDDISLEFFYKPHTITLLLISIGAVIYSAFTRFVSVPDFPQALAIHENS